MVNRLSTALSPYLLQHQDNPVDWWEWSDEALAAAAAQDRPIFLSIGYATCHWCHVMAHESFEDESVARLLNEAFINIKVDREERPDIDAIYMTVCQMLTGRGGWPLTIVMTPAQQPFFAATYIPKASRHGQLGMLELVPRIAELWRARRSDIAAEAARVTAALSRVTAATGRGATPTEAVLHQAYGALRARFDAVHGGFGTAPKFPSPTHLLFLLRYWRRTGAEQARQMVRRTLTAMRLGGIYDQVGWGFHRYATDASWTVPHFEKTLYDQAMLALTYTEAFQATGEALFEQTVHELFSYVQRELTDTGGGFYSAVDADSEGTEGKYYVWSVDEIQDVLPDALACQAVRAWNARPEGNYRDEATHRMTGTNILYLSEPLPNALEVARQALLKRRYTRIRPLTDDKILADWNGLMIAALARAARVLDVPSYADVAIRAADFVLMHMSDGADRMFHLWRQGSAAVAGLLDDYAFMTWGLLELYESTFDDRYLAQAMRYVRVCSEAFRARDGGFYLTPSGGDPLLVRMRSADDGSVPSGSAVMMMNLMRLARLTAGTDAEEDAWGIARSQATHLEQVPTARTGLLAALDYALGPASEVVIVGHAEAPDTRAMLKAARSAYLPGTLVLLRAVDRPAAAEGPDLSRFVMLQESATAYVCRDFACQAPTTDINRMLQQLNSPTR